jgi:putative spermidine/putrescine transport system permease protein
MRNRLGASIARWFGAVALRTWVVLALLFMYIPLIILAVYAFNSSNVQKFPIPGLSTRWFVLAWHDPHVHSALLLSIKAGAIATAISLLLGSAAAFGVHKFRFFGRETVSFLLVVPLALPGIITGIALKSAFFFAGVNLSLWTIVIGHATFCMVIVYNNVLARMRQTSGSLAEASMDLGAKPWQTLTHVTLPMLSTSLVAGGLLAFALSFDEVVVTIFTAGAHNTLPLWIWGSLRLGERLPEINAVILVILLVTIIPVVASSRLAGRAGIR